MALAPSHEYQCMYTHMSAAKEIDSGSIQPLHT